MASGIDFAALNQPTRCFALVGAFLCQWSLMEREINQAIGKVLGLEFAQTAIVAANISLRDKIHILRTALTITTMADKDDRERFNQSLGRVLN